MLQKYEDLTYAPILINDTFFPKQSSFVMSETVFLTTYCSFVLRSYRHRREYNNVGLLPAFFALPF